MSAETVSDAALERLARRSTADVRADAVPLATIEAIARELLLRRGAMRLIKKYYPDVLGETWEDE